MLSTATTTFSHDSVREQHTAFSASSDLPTVDPTAQSDISDPLLQPSFTQAEVLSLTNLTTSQTQFTNTIDQVSFDSTNKQTSVKPTLSLLHETTSTVADGFELPTVDATFFNSSTAFDLTQYYSELKELADKLEHQNGVSLGLLAENSKESSYELLFCPSQPFLARLSLHGQIFEA